MDAQGSPKNTPASGTRRRSSGLLPGFDSLQQHREASAVRRQSMSDQAAKGGYISQLFHNTFGRNASK